MCSFCSTHAFCAETAATVDSRWWTPRSRGRGYQLSHLANFSKHISVQVRFWPQQPHPTISLCAKPYWPNSIKLSHALKERGKEGKSKAGANEEGREKRSHDVVISRVETAGLPPATAATFFCYKSWAGRKWKNWNIIAVQKRADKKMTGIYGEDYWHFHRAYFVNLEKA